MVGVTMVREVEVGVRSVMLVLVVMLALGFPEGWGGVGVGVEGEVGGVEDEVETSAVVVDSSVVGVGCELLLEGTVDVGGIQVPVSSP
jgi:hypothetical protein